MNLNSFHLTLKCSRCKKHKVPKNFHRNSSYRRGWDYYCKKCRVELAEWRKYRKTTKGKISINKATKKAMHKSRFGGIREQIIQRDKERCVDCGMTRSHHKRHYGRDLSVRHIAGPGRKQVVSSKDYDNSLQNLITLCLKCNGKKY